VLFRSWAPFYDDAEVPDEIKQLPEVQARYEVLRADKAGVLAAVAQWRGALKYASAALKSDRDVVLAAVAQNGRALRYASAALQADPEVLLAAGR
jgi:CelD/BcsL family acetyltransferase involved in cellulose biosynthesis